MIDDIARHILGLHGFAALAIVFALPLLESSAFVGFVFPGEIAVVLGGVLAFEHRVSLPAVLVAAIAGAIIGDTVGYAVGHRYGRRLLTGRLGSRIARHEHVDRAERYLAERGGKAILLGRFTAALRVLIPGLAGMARMPYRTFVVYNVTGGVLWATGMVLLGYLAGASWQRAAHWASEVGLAVLALIVVGFVLRHAVRVTRRQSARLHAVGAWLAATGPGVWARRRFPAQLAWLRRRLDPATPDGVALTATVAAAVLAAWIFGGLTQDVTAGEGVAQVDPPGHAFAVAHRAEWLTGIIRTVTWLGSGWLLVPVLVVATIIVRRRRNPSDIGWLWAAYLGAVALYGLAKPLVHRARPPATDLLAATSGLSYPSGHATQAVAVWGMLAVIAGAGRSPRTRVGMSAAAAAVVLLVGATRIYLGTHWPTDVLAGYALGAAWLAVLLALRRRYSELPAERPDPTRRLPTDRPIGASDQPSPPPRQPPPRPRPGTAGPR